MRFNKKTDDSTTGSGELLFISHMRAMATIAVMLWHLGVVFWYSNGAVANLCHFEVMTDIDSAVPKIYTDIVTAISALNVDFGMFGVAIFFLISGFIIPYSVRGGGRANERISFEEIFAGVANVCRRVFHYIFGAFVLFEIYDGTLSLPFL